MRPIRGVWPGWAPRGKPEPRRPAYRSSSRDLLWYNAASGRIVVWRMDAGLVRLLGDFTQPMSAGNANWRVLAGGDYGVGPGGAPASNDIVWRNATSGKLVVWHLNPATNPITRTAGVFTVPDAPAEPLGYTVVGPR